MTLEFFDKMRDIIKEFFELPLELKQKYSNQGVDIQGYANKMVLSGQDKPDWNETLYLFINPEDLRKPELWPEKPQVFR